MITYPIDEILPLLKKVLQDNPSAVLHAPPGAGKTTRVPLALLDIVSADERIIMLEPRRIAAVSAARWMAHLLGEEVGRTVGYSIRFDRKVSTSTKIEVVTEGILTRRLQDDPALEGISLVIFDEFHERSLHADLALALCLDSRRHLREDLKLLVMSATLDTKQISELLGGAPVVSSAGKSFPVEERYLSDKNRLPERITSAVTRALHEDEGDILVFLPGAGEIRACADALVSLKERRREEIEIHPLYGDLPFDQQERAIMPAQKRKIVLATNIAETSLTIEGVRIVIDSGLTRRLQYDPSTGMNRLITVQVSKASAEQRKGRAGRIAPGICYRAYSSHEYQGFIPFAPPEILISDLSSLVLELAAWGVKEPSALSWLNNPPSAAWNSAKSLLQELDALDTAGNLTSKGRSMARLPLHPRLARLLIRADEIGCAGLGADVAAILSERDIIRRTQTNMIQPDICERIEFLRLWRTGKEMPNFADLWALRAVDRTSKQLARLVPKSKRIAPGNEDDTISRLLLCAFPDRIAKKREDSDDSYVLALGRGVRFPYTNSLSKNEFIVAAQMDAGERGEGLVYMASAVSEKIIREEFAAHIEVIRRVDWDEKEKRIAAVIEERIGSIPLSAKPFNPDNEESVPILCQAIKSGSIGLSFSDAARQLQGRVALMRRYFPDEDWPDLSSEGVISSPEEWLLPWLDGIRTAQGLAAIDIATALKAKLSWERTRLLDERAPAHIVVPSGNRVALDYASGDIPVLAVKLQEMFGLADTPAIAHGRVKLLLHLLSPAKRPLQITQDLKGFWDGSYQQVKKEMKGRYPKHPWPDDPWNALPTRKTKAAMKTDEKSG